ncbi:MAG: dihydrofolate reductase family protein, partial [Pseudonocardiaceae bacterium]
HRQSELAGPTSPRPVANTPYGCPQAAPTLVEGLLQANLLDEIRLEIYPVPAGAGAHLFKDGRAAKRLHLADSTTTSNGIAILTYQRQKRS